MKKQKPFTSVIDAIKSYPNYPKRDYVDIASSKDPIDRLVSHINGLSPHNLWKAFESIDILFAEQYETLIQERERLAKLEQLDFLSDYLLTGLGLEYLRPQLERFRKQLEQRH